MSKIKRIWLNIPRRQRIAINLLVILILAFSVYVFCGCPPFTAEQKFRRAEKANFVGPGEILGIYELEGFVYPHLLVADDSDGVIFYSFDNLIDPSENLVYREKTGDLTVLAAPDYRDYTHREAEVEVPVFLFDKYPEATRAELEFTLSTTLNNVYFEKDYVLESLRESDGYFCFNLRITSQGAESYAVQEFSRMCGYSSAWNLQSQPITVRLYGEDEELILEERILVRCVAGTVHPELVP